MATTTSTTASTAGAAAANDVAEGPVLSVVNKRLRALRKKLNRIVHTEESVAQGKPINKEQEEVLRSKPSVLALIDELEKLRSPLSAAVTEELNLALKNNNNHHQPKPQPEPESQLQPQPQPEPVSEAKNDDVSVVEDLINLIYFGSLFDVKSQNEFTSTMLTRTHERGCCLTYDYVTDDATDLLRERDLDLISAMRGLLISRPADSSLSHRDALCRCVEHARLWLARAPQPIEPNAEVTYAGLREKLNKIMSSEYFITTPEIKATDEVAAAAASGSYQSFQVPVHGTAPVEGEGGSVSKSPDQDEGAINYQGHGSGEENSDPEGELQKDEVEVENVEVVTAQNEQTNAQVDVEYNQRDMETKDQHYPRRGYQNQRGGRGGGGSRRGYSNGRGGRGGGGVGRGGYQNGRGQFNHVAGDVGVQS
ncbi:hypothetical protein AAHE18_05G093100 [Arachis hypogaea]